MFIQHVSIEGWAFLLYEWRTSQKADCACRTHNEPAHCALSLSQDRVKAGSWLAMVVKIHPGRLNLTCSRCLGLFETSLNGGMPGMLGDSCDVSKKFWRQLSTARGRSAWGFPCPGQLQPWARLILSSLPKHATSTSPGWFLTGVRELVPVLQRGIMMSRGKE